MGLPWSHVVVIAAAPSSHQWLPLRDSHLVILRTRLREGQDAQGEKEASPIRDPTA